tara:strand:- start:45 stop:395 length:351 start_codon:yes stop_codon:yes gene_type:complete
MLRQNPTLKPNGDEHVTGRGNKWLVIKDLQSFNDFSGDKKSAKTPLHHQRPRSLRRRRKMAKNKASKIASDRAQQQVADLYRRLRDDAAKIAYSTFGPQDPDSEQVEEELTGVEEQ